MRTINKPLLKKLVERHGGINRVAVDVKMSPTHLRMLMGQEYESVPRPLLMEAMCRRLVAQEDELFPVVQEEELESTGS